MASFTSGPAGGTMRADADEFIPGADAAASSGLETGASDDAAALRAISSAEDSELSEFEQDMYAQVGPALVSGDLGPIMDFLSQDESGEMCRRLAGRLTEMAQALWKQDDTGEYFEEVHAAGAPAGAEEVHAAEAPAGAEEVPAGAAPPEAVAGRVDEEDMF